jgi:EAL and modified HD-GYP domain-containing signal transduction protein
MPLQMRIILLNYAIFYSTLYSYTINIKAKGLNTKIGLIENTITTDNADIFTNFKFAMQPIVDINNKNFSYEALYRSNYKEEVFCGYKATAQVIINNTCNINYKEFNGEGTVIFVNLTKEHVYNVSILGLPKKNFVYELLESVIVDDDLITEISTLKREGYQFALDDYVANNINVKLLPFASFVKLDVRELSLASLKKHIQIIKREQYSNIKLIAEKIETEEELNICKDIGFDLFQGYYIEKPSLVSGAEYQPNTEYTSFVYKLLGDDHTYLKGLEALKAEPYLLHKLHCFSRNIGLPKSSINDAAFLLNIGKERLKLMLSFFLICN